MLGGAEGAKLLDRNQLLTPLHEVMQHPSLGTAWRVGRVLERDHAIPVGQRQCWIDDFCDQLVEGRANRNGHRHREAANQREPAMFDEHADAESGVERERVEPLPAARIPAGLFVFFDAPEANVRLAPCFLWIETVLAHQSIRFHLDVKPHLVAHIGFEPTRPDQHPPACAEFLTHRRVAPLMLGDADCDAPDQRRPSHPPLR